MSSKRKRSSKNSLPTDILSSLESSDRKAAKLRKSQLSTETLPRSHAAKSQVDIQTNLIECRILIQRALTALPQVYVSDEEDLDQKKEQDAQDKLDNLLSTLVDARRSLFSTLLQKEKDSSDEDTASESESDDEDSLESVYSKMRKTWKTTLNKHHANVHLQNQQNKNKFQVVDQSFWTQIENNLKHSAILDEAQSQEQGANASLGFEDSKLYQHMLQDYIALSAERGKDNVDYIALSAERGKDNVAVAAAERLKRSMKKKTKKDVDRRASKGRKIRYVVHEKLQNFTFPINRPAATMTEDVLFKSMFGGVTAHR